MPWLPQTIFVPARQTDVYPDDAFSGLEAGREPSRQLMEANREVELHQFTIRARTGLPQLMVQFQVAGAAQPARN